MLFCDIITSSFSSHSEEINYKYGDILNHFHQPIFTHQQLTTSSSTQPTSTSKFLTMKTFAGLIVAITIVSLLAPFCEAMNTFQEIQTTRKGDVVDLNRLVIFTRHYIESATLAFLMLELGPNKYLPHGKRTHAVLAAGKGSGNTNTGLLGFLRLQQELITLKERGHAVKPFQKVTVIISREKHDSDPHTIPPTGDESDEVKLARLKAILAGLKSLMVGNGYEYVEYFEPMPDANKSAEEVTNEMNAQFKYVKTLFVPDEIALCMDILTGSGKQTNDIAEKARLTLMVPKFLNEQGVPVLLHDGRSGKWSNGFEPYELTKPDKVYGIHTGRVISTEHPQGLIVTDLIKKVALKDWESVPAAVDMGHLFGDRSSGRQAADPKTDILVAHGKVLTKDLTIFEAMIDPTQYTKAFESILVEDIGFYRMDKLEKDA